MNYDILKNFAIGFVPIFVFIIIDSFYGTTAGLITALISGVLYFFYYLIRFKRIEKMILLDTGLILLTGGVSLLFNDAIFFKLKPAIIEFIMTVLIGVHAFSNKPVLLEMGKRYMADLPINKQQLYLMKQLSRLLFLVFIVHTALITYSAFFWSDSAWAFVSGGLFYILMGFIVIGQFIYLKFVKKPEIQAVNFAPVANDADELFDVVDQQGKIIGSATRSQVHGNPNLIHPVVHLHILNQKGQLYLQKRAASKDLYPGLWDTAVGGHVHKGEPIQKALEREAQEELGVRVENPKPLIRYLMRSAYESELVHVFKIHYNGPFKINRQEVENGRFFSIFEIKKLLGRGVLTPNFEYEFQLLISNKLL